MNMLLRPTNLYVIFTKSIHRKKHIQNHANQCKHHGKCCYGYKLKLV